MASNRMATRASGRGRLLKGLALGDLTNVAPAERQQAGKAAGSGLKNLISEAVGAISGAGKRKRVSAAVADVENEKVEARPAKAGRVGSGPRARRLQSACGSSPGAPPGCTVPLATPTGFEPVDVRRSQVRGSSRRRTWL